jgi:hypothetical protein
VWATPSEQKKAGFYGTCLSSQEQWKLLNRRIVAVAVAGLGKKWDRIWKITGTKRAASNYCNHSGKQYGDFLTI